MSLGKKKESNPANFLVRPSIKWLMIYSQGGKRFLDRLMPLAGCLWIKDWLDPESIECGALRKNEHYTLSGVYSADIL